MRERLKHGRGARQGKRSGNAFRGCSDYPRCKGTRPMAEKSDQSDQETTS